MNYPNKKNTIVKEVVHANLGMSLENDVNQSNKYYLDTKIAVIHKKPIPVQIVKVDFPARNRAKIIEAYYKIPSTTDYNGIYRGYYIDFDCKETNNKTSFPLKNLYDHQYQHLLDIKNLGGIGFLFFYLKTLGTYYLLSINDIETFRNNNDIHSLPFSFIKEKGIIVKFGFNPRLDYLKAVDEFIKILFNK
jgi:recombination protein U